METVTKSSKGVDEYVATTVGFVDVGSSEADLPAWMNEEQVRKDRAIQIGHLRPPRLPRAVGRTLRYEGQGEEQDASAELGTPEALHGALNALSKSIQGETGVVSRPVDLAEQPVHAFETDGQETRQGRNDTVVEDLLHQTDEEALRQLSDCIREFWSARTRMLESSETTLVELVGTICRRVLAREVSVDPGIVHGLVREGLTALGDADQIIVKVGPFFAEVAHSLRDSLAASGIRAQVLVDDFAKPYACSVGTELGYVDESLEARLQALIEDATCSQVSGTGRGAL